MMKGIVTKYDWYAAWEYEKEEQALNEASKKGLQLVKGGCFHSKFRKDNSVRYIYQLDYNPNINDTIRYQELFEEQGWEYINSTYNGWHYFRKPYKEGMDEAEKRIYTDKQSLCEMQNRWLRMIIGIDIFYILSGAFYLIHGIINGVNTLMIEGFIFLALALTFSLGILSIMRKRAGKKSCFVIPMQIALPLALVFFLFILASRIFDLNLDVVHEEKFTFHADTDDSLPLTGGTFAVDKSGEYEIHLDINVEGGIMTVAIQDEEGNEAYHVSAGVCTVDGYDLELEKGNYKVLYSYQLDENYQDEREVSVDLEISKW